MCRKTQQTNQMFGMGSGRVGNRRMNPDLPDYSIVNIGQNTEESSRDQIGENTEESCCH